MAKPVHHSSSEATSSDILINILLDRSGSMSGLEGDVIGQFNGYIKSQKEQPGRATVSLVLFDDRYENVYTDRHISEVPELSSTVYFTRGSTALLDALGKLIQTVDGIKNKPSKIVFLINTDGYENASHEFTKAKIKELITERQDNHDWQFVFIGAGIDAFSEGGSLGVRAYSTVSVAATGQGITNSYASLGSTTTAYRSGILSNMDFSGIVPPDLGEQVAAEGGLPKELKRKKEKKVASPG